MPPAQPARPVHPTQPIDPTQTFVKHDHFHQASLLGEAAGLAWLAEAEEQGGLHVARVLSASEEELVEERIVTTSPTARAAEATGRALARTHAAGAPWWGAPPTGYSGPHRIDGVPTQTTREDEAPASWGAFYANWRIRPFVRLLRDNGTFDSTASQLLERVAARCESQHFDAPQPGLLRQSKQAVARLHGDLWAGNLLWDANPANTTGATLIDPMAHGGHAECDLAMLQLFGCAQLGRLIAAYDELSPLADGWRERVGLHQLAPLLLHCALFGGSYVAQTLATARRYS